MSNIEKLITILSRVATGLDQATTPSGATHPLWATAADDLRTIIRADLTPCELWAEFKDWVGEWMEVCGLPSSVAAQHADVIFIVAHELYHAGVDINTCYDDIDHALENLKSFNETNKPHQRQAIQ